MKPSGAGSVPEGLAMPLAICFLLSACTGEPASRPTASLPYPALDSLEPVVAETLAFGRARLESSLATEGLPAAARARALGTLGKRYHAHRLLVAAEACYRAAHGEDPSQFAWAYYYGVLAAGRGDLVTAARAFGNAVAIRSEDVPALTRLADLELDRGNIDEAQMRYEQALRSAPSLAAAEYGLGRIAAERGAYPRAIELFSRVLERQSDASVLHYHLGQAYRQLGRLGRARHHLTMSGPARVAMVDPLMHELMTLGVGASPLLALGNAASRDGRWTDAIDHYRNAVAAAPGHARARQRLGSALIRVGEMDKALPHVSEAVRLEPENARAHADLGALLGALDDDRQALVHLRQALRLEPDLTRAVFNLANTLARTGALDEAVQAYERVLEIEPNHASANARLKALRAFVSRHRSSPRPS